MMLLTAANRKALPALYANENAANPKAVVKFFTPDANATWYASEFDGDDTFFGLADLGFGFPELGNFSLSELQNVRGKMGLPVERDRHFTPKPLSELMNEPDLPRSVRLVEFTQKLDSDLRLQKEALRVLKLAEDLNAASDKELQ
jgi:hypothetical protein